MTHFFISYAKKETRDLALALDDALNTLPEVTAWVDKSLRAGQSWELQIQTEIDRCDFMIVLYSPDINRHKQGEEESYLLTEIAYAKYTAKKRIIPVMAQKTDPPLSLTMVQYIDFTIGGLSLDDLVTALCDEAGIKRDALPFDPILAEMEKAKFFKGTQNSDWTPVIQTIEVQGVAFEVCLVPPGSFMMGSHARDDEKPIHAQTFMQPFWIGRYPVTNRQWRALVELSSGAVSVPEWTDWYRSPSRAEHPVVGVTWRQCAGFARELGIAQAASVWRLPNEAEWEYAARGPNGFVYPWGNDWQVTLAVIRENSHGRTAVVGEHPGGASWVGAQDMSGNVWEWTKSFYRAYPYKANDDKESTVASTARVARGGSWFYSRINARAAYRQDFDPNLHFSYLGFRLVYCPVLS